MEWGRRVPDDPPPDTSSDSPPTGLHSRDENEDDDLSLDGFLSSMLYLHLTNGLRKRGFRKLNDDDFVFYRGSTTVHLHPGDCLISDPDEETFDQCAKDLDAIFNEVSAASEEYDNGTKTEEENTQQETQFVHVSPMVTHYVANYSGECFQALRMHVWLCAALRVVLFSCALHITEFY